MVLFALTLLGAAVGLMASFYVWRWFQPIEASEFKAKLELRWSGVKTVEYGGLKGYLRNHCIENPTADAQQCVCVAWIHGLGDQALTWKRVLQENPPTWNEKRLKLVALNLPGSGDSPAPAQLPEGYRVRKQAEALAKALDQVPGCPRWMLVGNSLGGWVATWVALDWTNRVNKLLLVGPGGLKYEGLHASDLLKTPTIETLKEFQAKAYYQAKPLPDHVWKAALERMKKGNSAQVLAAQTPADYLDTYLPSIRIPTLVFRGGADQIAPREVVQEMARLIPGALYREAPACGHLPQKECVGALVRVVNELVLFGAI